MKYAFKLYIDSRLAKTHWDDGMVLELELEGPDDVPPTASDVVLEAIDFVNDLDDSCEEHIQLKRVFAKAMTDGSEFVPKLDLTKSKC